MLIESVSPWQRLQMFLGKSMLLAFIRITILMVMMKNIFLRWTWRVNYITRIQKNGLFFGNRLWSFVLFILMALRMTVYWSLNSWRRIILLWSVVPINEIPVGLCLLDIGLLLNRSLHSSLFWQARNYSLLYAVKVCVILISLVEVLINRNSVCIIIVYWFSFICVATPCYRYVLMLLSDLQLL